jgi:hypothetical protein
MTTASTPAAQRRTYRSSAYAHRLAEAIERNAA